MAYRVPTLDEMMQFMVALARSLFPGRNVGSRFSFYWKLLKIIAGAATDVHAHVDAAGKDVMPDTATGAMQDRWLKIVGTKRKGATPARKSKALRLTGTTGSPFSVGAILLHRPTGQTFQLNQSGTIPVAGFIDVDVLAVSVGSATRLNAGETLEFAPKLTGIATNAELQINIDEDGTDVELEGAATVRLLSILGKPSSGGNQADYVAWALEQNGVSTAYCYPNRAGVGSVDVAALHTGSGTSRLLNAGERAALLAALQERAPSQVGGVGGALRILQTTPEVANVEIVFQPSGPSYALDWDDSVVPTVLTWTPETRVLQFSAARPTTMKAGDRVCIYGVAGGGGFGACDCAPIQIESLTGADSIILASAPLAPDGTPASIAATDKVYAAGPLTSIIRDAVIAHLNADVLYASASGPLPGAVAASKGISTTRLQILLDGLGTSNPAGKYGDWIGTLQVGSLQTIARFTRGVRSASVLLPVADVDSMDYPFPLDVQIGVFQAGFVLVRRGG